MKTYYSKINFVTVLLLLFQVHVLIGQKDTTKKSSIFDLLYMGDLHKVDLSFDVNQLIQNKYKDTYQPGKFTWHKSKEESIEFKVEVKPRGKFRLRTCDFPPIKLKFKKDDLEKHNLSKKYNSMKLVTHCMEVDGENTLTREFLAYELFNILSEASFRVQMLEVSYRDKSNKRVNKKLGFLIEDEEQIGKRLKGKVCDDCFNHEDSLLNKQDYQMISLFQFMIGNEDWSVRMLRNVKLYKVKGSDFCNLVPYDFDFSGLVNAPYAIPNSDYGLSSPTQRKFLGNATTFEELKPVIQHFEEKKEAIIDHVKNADYLKSMSKKHVIQYINSFYNCLELKDQILTKVIDFKRK